MLLYPPYIEGILPAMVEGKTIIIPYTMNPGVGLADFNRLVL